ncbi:hypothetical protein B0T16DRAFT_392296 [Cercophora newfieldiana]|uniref:Uncharacterized protein n=1 Tax=Cercophora newfieldiana TaxID=92897 RepID=A0AA39Y0V0_9PEZI|nr:hypothetical protein B0T16DRAFT_392296 [Cercophora newfieldiana]
MTLLHTIITALAMGTLTLSPLSSALPTITLPTITLPTITNTTLSLPPSQSSYWAHKFILDPLTNLTIPNPSYPEHYSLSKREPFNPPPGAECRISATHYYYIKGSYGRDPKDYSYDLAELWIRDHKNTGTRFAMFDMVNGKEEAFKLDGHRSWIGSAGWELTDWYAIRWAKGRIEGRGGERNMMGSDYCWYESGKAWWGYWSEASCSVWCSEFKW